MLADEMIQQSKAILQAMPTDIMSIVIDRLGNRDRAGDFPSYQQVHSRGGSSIHKETMALVLISMSASRTMMLLFIFAIPPVIPFDLYAAVYDYHIIELPDVRELCAERFCNRSSTRLILRFSRNRIWGEIVSFTKLQPGTKSGVEAIEL
ncbi:hypothetical protein N7465_009707 [Penicillium sp. CMV-2018d]|nr:hypothetical protein N7465_009707 [Penicillium sp. CMV-2018d]